LFLIQTFFAYLHVPELFPDFRLQLIKSIEPID